MHELEQWLLALTGMDRMSLQPAAGAHGEWTGLRMIQAYLADQGDTHRDTVLVPDSAHGTNPASASLAGLKSVTVKSTPSGLVDLDDYRAKLGPHVAAVMLTNPNTLGVFERDILEIARLAHEAGALLYYDGANLNALVGMARPGDMGFDVVHLNLHKTFSTPHGGGGPGAGPCGVKARLAPYLPVPVVEKNDAGAYRLDWERPKSIGKVRSFVGNFAVLVKAYAYMRAYGGDGLRQVAQDAVLNANYLKARLARTFDVASEEPSLHEFVLTTRKAREHHVTNADIAKRLLDYGFYAPTVSFPLTVPEALMVEPTETESRETLDAFVAVMDRIWTEVQDDPELVQNAPHETPVGRLDEVRAARPQTMKLTWRRPRGLTRAGVEAPPPGASFLGHPPPRSVPSTAAPPAGPGGPGVDHCVDVDPVAGTVEQRLADHQVLGGDDRDHALAERNRASAPAHGPVQGGVGVEQVDRGPAPVQPDLPITFHHLHGC